PIGWTCVSAVRATRGSRCWSSGAVVTVPPRCRLFPRLRRCSDDNPLAEARSPPQAPCSLTAQAPGLRLLGVLAWRAVFAGRAVLAGGVGPGGLGGRAVRGGLGGPGGP